ncbi:hypothetical protein O6H91_08G066800 [Diphasiastrum complanatum]|uniref:Uncharacterized protein n=1 Tax=Diphasiastrum complanatum TaxID=34168 RepID=A0ACC2CYF0_DIPCM|nr:hypothetical protein O6H91_08G066800 [Diphasiastrum complanatum]
MLERLIAPALVTEEYIRSVAHLPQLPDLSKILSSTERKSDDALTRWQQAEQKLQVLAEKLSVALSENTAKDNVVKQHTKVAEEAVCGWEKAEAEANTLKLQLDNVLQQKAAMEDRLSHVDGALKECMWQLRQVREEQEQKIHDTIIKNKREWDKVQAEFEAKIVEMDHQLLDSNAENEVLTRSLQERGRTIAELNNVNTQAQTELSIFQIRLDSAEKEKSSLKYEVQVLNKELDIRNEERVYSKRENEASNKQHLENTTKIAKLEAECQKLRVLVRRKLPGPAALAQMKIEVEPLGSELGDMFRRRGSGKHPRSYGASHLEVMQHQLQHGSREIEMLTERMYAMEEETRMLREALAQRNNELHAARLMCARTASKLSTVESHLEAFSHSSAAGLSGADVQVNGSRDLTSCKTASVLSLSDGSIHDDEASSDVWASALVSELAQFKREKPVVSPENMLHSAKLSLMDDFTEMEHLASTITSEEINVNIENQKRNEISSDHNAALMKELVSSEELVQKNTEIQNTNFTCMELRSTLAATEKQLSELQSKNNANEAVLIDLQDRLDFIFEAHSEGADMNTILDKARAAMTAPENRRQDRSSNRGVITNILYSNDTSLSDTSKIARFENANGDIGPAPKIIAKETSEELNRDLIVNVRKVIKLLHTLAQRLGATCTGNVLQLLYDEDQTPVKAKDPDLNNLLSSQTESSLLDNSIQKMFRLSNKLLDGQSSFLELMREFYFFLEAITKLAFISLEMSQRTANKLEDSSRESSAFLETNLNNAVHPNLTTVTKEHMLDDICKLDESNGSSLKDKEEMPSHESPRDCNLEDESNRFAGLEEELVSLKAEKAEIEHSLEEALQKIESITAELLGADQLVTELRDKLDSCQKSEQLVEEQLASMKTSTATLEAHVKSGDALVSGMQKKIHTLELELQEERRNSQKVCVKLQELQLQLDGMRGSADETSTEVEGSEDPHQSAEMVGRSHKEKEITAAAEKLAECQRTILVLGEQLKALTSPKQSPEASFSSKTESASSAEKVIHSFEPCLYQSEELQSEIDVSGPSMHSGGLKSSPGTGWSRGNGYQEFDQQSPWSPPSHIVSTYAPRGPLGSPYCTERKYVRQVDPDKERNKGVQPPDESEYVEAEISTPASPTDAYNYSGGKSPARFLAIKKRSTSSQDISKASNAARPEKSGSSAFSRFFSRTKSQLTQ